MPIPTPKKGEKNSDFVLRCIKDEVMKKEYKDKKQRIAICFKQTRKAKKISWEHNNQLRKEGRVLSKTNKAVIEKAVTALQDVLNADSK